MTLLGACIIFKFYISDNSDLSEAMSNSNITTTPSKESNVASNNSNAPTCIEQFECSNLHRQVLTHLKTGNSMNSSPTTNGTFHVPIFLKPNF